MLILYKFSLFNINRSYIVRNYGVAATFLGTSASNRIVVTIETAVTIEDELNIIVCKKKGETLITANPLFYRLFHSFLFGSQLNHTAESLIGSESIDSYFHQIIS